MAKPKAMEINCFEDVRESDTSPSIPGVSRICCSRLRAWSQAHAQRKVEMCLSQTPSSYADGLILTFGVTPSAASTKLGEKILTHNRSIITYRSLERQKTPANTMGRTVRIVKPNIQAGSREQPSFVQKGNSMSIF